MFLKTGNPIIITFDFLKRFCTLYDLLIDLLNAIREQNDLINKIEEVKDFILLEEKGITSKNTQSIKRAKTKTQRKEIFSEQRSVLRSAFKLHDKRNDIINAFVNEGIYSGDVEKDVHYKSEESEPKFEESIAVGTKKHDKNLMKKIKMDKG